MERNAAYPTSSLCIGEHGNDDDRSNEEWTDIAKEEERHVQHTEDHESRPVLEPQCHEDCHGEYGDKRWLAPGHRGLPDHGWGEGHECSRNERSHLRRATDNDEINADRADDRGHHIDDEQGEIRRDTDEFTHGDEGGVSRWSHRHRET